MRSRLALAGALLALAARRAEAGVKTWNTAADFETGVRYGVTATGSAPLTLGLRRTYDWNSDPAIDPNWSYWSSLATDATGVGAGPAEVGAGERMDIGVASHVAVVIGDRLYVIGGVVPSNNAPCDSGANVITSAVLTSRFQADGRLGPWFTCPLAFGQAAAADPPVPLEQAAAAVVGRRVYISGGLTYISTTDYAIGTKDLNTVWSAEPDPATGMLGPWRQERAVLAGGVFGHAMLYAGGALFVLGGNSKFSANNGKPSFRTVQRADIRFDGTLFGAANPDKFDLLPDMPPGSPTGNTCVDAACDGLCNRATDCVNGNDDSRCRSGVGWSFINAFAVQRSLGFSGAAYTPGGGTECKIYQGEYVGVVDDCNTLAWTPLPGKAGVHVYPDAGVVVVDDLLLVTGGTLGTAAQVTTVYPPPTNGYTVQPHGIERDPSSPDAAVLRPAALDGVSLVSKGSLPPRLPQAMGDRGPLFGNDKYEVSDAPLVAHGDSAYLVGGNHGGAGGVACNRIRRAVLPSATWFAAPYMAAGYYLSAPVDLGGASQLTRVAWTLRKNGAGAGDDWAAVRYRVAGEDQVWGFGGCDGGWSPRIPDTGAMPAAAGTYTYDSGLAKSDPLWMPLFSAPNGYRYVQFEVSLFNDGANDAPAPTLPEFLEFRVEYEPATAPPVEAPTSSFVVYPTALGGAGACALTLQFTMTPAGGEAHARVFNAAGRQVARGDWRYGPVTGAGLILAKETMDVCAFAPGAYLVLLEALGADGRGGLVNVKSPGGASMRKAQSRFVVRR